MSFILFSVNVFAVECPTNSTLVNNACVCDTGYTETNNNFDYNLKATSYSVTQGTPYMATLETANGQITLLATGHSENSGVLPVSTPGGTNGGSKCWCRISYPFETSWKYSGSSISGDAGTDAWFEACVSKCGDKLRSNNIASWFNGYVLNNGLICEAAPIQITYSINYYLDGGNGCSSTTYTNSETICVPSKQNYKFMGWATSNGGNVVYYGNESVSNVNLDLYAIWGCVDGYSLGLDNKCYTNISSGKYVVSEPLPEWVDVNADAPGNESSIQYHGYNNNQASENIPENSFYTVFDYGKIYGDSACLTYGSWGDVSDEDFSRGNVDGGYVCWCRLNGENDPNNNYSYKSKWVARGILDNNQPCWENCAHDCAQLTGHVYRWPDNSIKETLFNTAVLRTADCPAGSYCPGGDIELGTNGQYLCPENSHSETGSSSCVCDTKYETVNGAGATIENPCVRKTGPDSCDAETEYWDAQNQTCVTRIYSCSFILQAGQYIPPVYDISGIGYKCHTSRTRRFCDNESLIADLPDNSWLVHFGDEPQTIFGGRSACSDIGGSYKELSDVPFDSDTIYGANCWCNMTDLFGSEKWILSGTFENGDICGNECAGNCGDHFSWDNDFKKTLLSTVTPTPTDCVANSFCPGGEYSCLDTTASIEKCPDEYPNSDEGATDKTKCYATLTFVTNGGSAVAVQKKYYSDANAGGYTLNTIPTTTRQNSNFVAWYEKEDFSGNPITTSSQLSGNKTLYAKWQTTIYTIKYVDEDNNTLTTTNPTQWIVGETEPFDLTDPEIPEGWVFNAWYTDNLIYQGNSFGNKITHIDETTLVSLGGNGTTVTIYGYRYPKSKFTITTTQMSANEKILFTTRFAYNGDLYVVWDDGYISKFHAVNNTNGIEFTHNYKESGVYNIGLSSNNISGGYKNIHITDKAHVTPTFAIGNWTGSNMNNTPLKVAGISGSLGAVFPTLDSAISDVNYSNQPNFVGAFWGCTNLTGEIPEDLFEGIYGQPGEGMFYGVFGNCTNLGTENGVSTYGIPENLFSNISGTPTHSVFYLTFSGCNNLKGQITDNLLGNIYGPPAEKMFSGTFSGCSNLYGPIPQNLFRNINGVAKASMYERTFESCSGLTGNITEGFFGTITGPIQDYAFSKTFKDASGLTGQIPENLFGTVTGTAKWGFYETFNGATNIGKDENGNATPIPARLFSNISGTVNSSNEMFVGTFGNTQYLTAPVPTELFSGITGYLSDNDAGNRTSTYTAGGMSNIFDGSNIPTSCDAGQYQYLTGFEIDWNGRVACEMCPTEYPDSISGDNVTMKKCFTECPSDDNGGEYVSGHKYWTEDEEHIGDISSCVYRYTITYELNGADELLNSSNPTEYLSNIDADLIISAPDEREFFSFVGWYDNAEFTGDAITTIPFDSVGNITLYANWNADIFDITYELDGGENYENAPASYTVDSDTIVFGRPTKEGYNFVHWLDENGDVITEIPHGSNGNKTLTAVWELAEYRIIYDYTNGGSGCNNEYYTVGVEKELSCVPTNTGYIFNGWFDDENNQIFVIPSDSIGDITIYAQWTPETYYIEYVLNGGQNFDNAPMAYNYGTETLIEGIPTKKNFSFLGWCSDEELLDCYDTYVIPDDAIGKQTIYAKWTFYCESQKWLHVGEGPNDKICLTDEKPEGPSMAIQTNDGVYYIILSNENLNINQYSDKKMRLQYNNDTYNAHDDSI